jgi:ATP-binding cassette, subfamily B, bacterial
VLVLSVVDGAVPVAAAWFLRLLINGLSAEPISTAAVSISVAGIVGCGWLEVLGRAGQQYLRTVLQRSIRTLVEGRLFRAIHAVPGLSGFEDPRKLDQIRLAGQAGESAPDSVLNSGLGLVQAAITGMGFVTAILLLYPWLLAVVLLAAVPTCLLQLRLARSRADLLLDTSTYHRRLVFYRFLAIDVRAAKEVRLFGLGDFLIGRMLGELGSSNRAEAAVDRVAARIELTIGALSGFVTLCGATAAAYLAAHHRLTVGDVTVLLAAVVALQTTIASVTEHVSDGYRGLLLFQQYLAVVEPTDQADLGTGAVGELAEGIDFSDVWFRYAEDLPWVLRGVSCRLPAGQAVGLVGLNGAGKTTMVKLLCRLYEPERGTIRWDGIDIRTLDPAALRRRISAVFQDFMAYDFTASDNVAIGSLDARSDPERIRRAAVRAGVDAKLQSLPHGYRTMLSRIFPADEDGRTAELSGGEWQRVALARAFLRTDADLMILDEPTAGLDAEVEHELHQSLRGFRSGRLSLLISHRLSTLSSAELILVLADGEILERGTPAELLAGGGAFARLYRLQAAGYRLDDADWAGAELADPVPPGG